jgi:hypothetical protein
LATFANSLSSFINLRAFNEWLNDVRVAASKSRHENPSRALDYRRFFRRDNWNAECGGRAVQQ